MPLPTNPELQWPPEDWSPIYGRYREHAAWYSGEPNQLGAAYNVGPAQSTDNYSAEPILWRTNFDRFWSRIWKNPQTRQMLHVPAAGDIATTSADLLFAEDPEFVIEEAQQNGRRPESHPVQDRLDQLVEEAGIVQTLTEAAEAASALGGVFLRVTWDHDVEPDHPLLTAVDVDAAIPEFRWGRLMAVTFWQVVEQDRNKVWRHLERHEPGVVLHGLYEGTLDKLGVQRPLAAKPELGLEEEQVDTGVDQLTAVYIPNMRPNRCYRNGVGAALGRSDYQGIEAVMDALDETWTSWMRDLRLARARLFVPREYFQALGKGKGAQFDIDQEVYEQLDMAIGRDAPNMITPNQFAIRVKEHADTAQALLERVISAAGYSPATFGLEAETRTITATEIINRERRSFVTRGKKMGYWRRPVSDILETLLAVDVAQGFAQHEVLRPRIDFADSVQEDPGQVAQTAQLLRAAQAASTETLVRLVNPEWTDEEVNQEVARIAADQQPTVVTTAHPQQTTRQDGPGQMPEAAPASAQGGLPNGQEATTR